MCASASRDYPFLDNNPVDESFTLHACYTCTNYYTKMNSTKVQNPRHKMQVRIVG